MTGLGLGIVVLWIVGANFLELFDWDELNFAETAREMVVSGNWLQPTVNYLPFHEKPPLFAWLQAICFQIFGVGSFAARLPNVLCGGLTALLLFRTGSRLHGTVFGRWWAIAFGCSILPQFYFMSAIIDPWFNLFIFLSVSQLLSGGRRAVVWSGLALGGALLVKGPVAGLIVGIWCLLALFFATERRCRVDQFKKYVGVALIALLPFLVWIGLLWRQDGGFFATEFIRYQWRLLTTPDAGHGGFPGYHVVVLLLGCFPASFLALRPLWRRADFGRDYDRGMRWLFWIVLILFSIVSTKIVHYSSLCYFPLTWFAARQLTATDRPPVGRTVRTASLVWLGTCVLALLLTVLLGMNRVTLLPYIEDVEVVGRLAFPVAWPGWLILLPLAALIGWGRLLLRRRSPQWPAYLFGFTFLLTYGTIVGVFPRVIAHNQGALTEFYRAQRGEAVYLGTAYHKSYAHWYHAALPPERGGRARQYRFHESIDLPLRFSSPQRFTERVLREVPDARLLYQRGGYSFYERMVGPLGVGSLER